VVDEHAVRELELYADNDGALYKARRPYLDNMLRRMEKGTYDAKKGVKLWEYFAARAAKSYAREFGGSWSRTFPPAVRRRAAEHFEREARAELRG
jgi:hypothetical protein